MKILYTIEQFSYKGKIMDILCTFVTAINKLSASKDIVQFRVENLKYNLEVDIA
jgi:hypothetical protein